MRKNHSSTRSSTAPHPRSGLAPLEMVLLTPFLVLMGALMICFGDAALWKIRAQMAVHYAGTQTESFRAGDFAGFSVNPRPANWPQPAALGGGGRSDLTSVQDLFWNQTGPLDVAALQGNQGGGTQTQLVEDVYMGNRLTVNRQFVAEKGVHAGSADLTKSFPMLTRLLPNNGRYRIDHENQFLTRDWYFSDLGLGWNADRRANHLYNQKGDGPYNLEPSKNLQIRQLWNQFYAAFNQLRANPKKVDLDYLDHDQEWLIYHPGSTPPDFHPTRPSGCELYMEDYLVFELTQNGPPGPYRAYLESIRRVPLRMAQAWYSTYYGELRLRDDPNYVPKGPLSDVELEARSNDLRNYIDRLRAAGYK